MSPPKKPSASKPVAAPTPAEDQKKPGRTGSNINTYVDDDIRVQVDAFIASHNAKDEHPATLRSTIEAALKMYLKEKGFWPPKPVAPTPKT